MKNITAIYTRLSIDDDHNKEDSLDIQVELCRATSDQLKLTVNEDYVIRENWSGKDWDLKNRVGLGKIYDGASNGDFDHLIVRDASRLTRSESVAPYLSFLGQMKKFGVNVQFTNGTREDSQHREIIDMLEGWSSGQYVKDFLNKSKIKKEKLVAENKIPHGTNVGLYGYDTNKKDHEDENLRHKRTINPEESKAVEIVFRKMANGMSSIKISDYLNANGYKSKTGKSWSSTAVRRMVRNSAYYGDLVWNMRERVGTNKNSKIVMKPESEWKIIQIDPIVSRRLWNKANSQLSSRTKVRTDQQYLLSGFIRCGNCGATMSGAVAKGRKRKDGTYPEPYFYYRCRNKWMKNHERSLDYAECDSKQIRLDSLEAEIFKYLKDITSDPELFIKNYEKNQLDKLPHLIDDLKVITESLSKLNNQKKEIINLKIREHIDQDFYEKEFNRITKEISDIESAKDNKESEIETLKQIAVAGADIKRWMFEFKDYEFDRLSSQERIELLQAIGLAVEVITKDTNHEVYVTCSIGIEKLTDSKLEPIEEFRGNDMLPLHEHRHNYMQISRISG